MLVNVKLFVVLSVFAVAFNSNSQTVVYNIGLSGLVNQAFVCGTSGQYNGCSGNYGATWTSTNAVTPTSITVQFYTGVNCTGAGLRTKNLNGVSNGNITLGAGAGCFCDGVASPIFTTTLNPANYNPGGVNTFLISGVTSCEGFHPNGFGAGTYVRVTVVYAATPCNSISALTCGATASYSLTAGAGQFNNLGPFTTPGKEKIYSFTAPTTGAYNINVVHNNGYYVDLFSKTGACAATGWNYINDVLGNETSTVNLSAGVTYLFLLDDEDLNPSSGTISITCPNPCANFAATSTAPPILCNGGTTIVTVSATGGSAPYIGTGTFIRPAGTYTFPVSSANGCSTTTTITIGQPSAVVASSTAPPIACNGGTTTVTVTATGGSGPYTGTGSFTRPAGTHSFPVTSANGCSTSTTITIGQPSAVVASSSATPILCNGGTSTVTVTASGGTGPHSGTGTFTRPAGTHTFPVTDANGCTTSTTITIGQPSALVASSSATSILCNEGTSTVTITASGGTGPYSGTGTFTRPAGTHTFPVTDANGCTTSTTITIGQPSAVVASSTATPILCNGGTSTVTVVATGGTASYTGTGTFTVGAGTSTFPVTDANGCTTSTIITIGQPSALVASSTATPILCNGGTSTVTVTATGGTAPYSGIGTFTVGTGTYSYTVVDANGCASVATGTLTEPTPLVVSSNGAGQSGPCYGANVAVNGNFQTYTGSVTQSNAWINSNLTNWKVSHGTPSPSGNLSMWMWSYNGLGEGVYMNHNFVAGQQYRVTYEISQSTDANPTSQFVVRLKNNLVPASGTSFTIPSTAGTQLVSNIGWNLSGGVQTITETFTATSNYSQLWFYPYLPGAPTPNQAAALIDNIVIESVIPCTSNEILCNGGTTNVTVSATGGTAPYSGTGTFTVGAGTYTYNVSDANNCSELVTVTITEPAPLVLSISATEILCNGQTTNVSVSASGGTAPYSGIGTFTQSAGTYTYTVTDANGCTETISITVTEPTLLVASASASVIPCIGGTTNVTVAATGGTAPYSGNGIYNVSAGTYTYTVTDSKGCTSNVTITVTENDSIPPIASCQNLTIELDANGTASITANDVDNGSSDACGIASLSISQSAFSCSNVGANIVILTVVDNGGNTSTCSATVTVNDNVAPIASCQNVTIELDANGNASITANDVDNGSSDACGIASLSISQSAFDCSNVGANSVTLTVVDNNGNVSTCSATVTVNDNVAPIASCQNVTIELDANGTASITANDVDNGSSDACGIASLSISQSAFSCSNVGANIVILTVVDNGGNTSTCSATVTVNDNVAPIASCQNVTIELDANGTASITANDVDNGSSDACGIASLSISQSAFDCSNVGANSVTLTVVDNNGNVSTCSATVTVNDNVAPIASCQNLVIELDANGTASITANDVDNGSSDACGIASLSISQSAFSCSNVGANIVILTVVDNGGNTSTCSATVTVNDNVAPIASCQNVTIELDANGTASITANDVDNGSSDACGIASLSISQSAFDCSNVGANSVTLTVVDNNGNVSTCSATVTVNDNVAPIASCQNLTIELDANGNASITANDVNNGSSDACGIASLSISQSAFDCSNVGANSVTLTVVDNNGNVSTCSATVTVNDNIAPTAICQDLTVTLDASGNASVTASDLNNGSFDNCGAVTTSIIGGTASYTCVDVAQTFPVTLLVTDANGNSSTCVAQVTVGGTQLVASASSTTILCFGGTATVTIAAIGGAMPYSGTGTFTVLAGTYTYTVTDAQSCTADVTILVDQPDQIEANITPQNHVIDCVPIPVTLTANPTGGTGGPYTYLWSTGATTSSIEVNPNTTTSYSVQVTDGNGCTVNAATNGTTVTVVNRCGNDNQKVVICHVPHGNSGNPQTLCISPNALNGHLSSLWDLHGGDYCGPCQTSSALTLGTTNNGDNTFIRAGININNETIELSYRIGYDSPVRLEIYDMAGALVDVVYSGQAIEGELYELKLNTDKISSGVYIYQFITDSETHIDKLQIIQ